MITKGIKARSDYITRNYILNEIKTVHLGMAIASFQEGQTELKKEWVGLDHSPNGFKTVRENSDWLYKMEILFQGSFDGRISFFIQEFIDNVWNPTNGKSITINTKDAKIFRYRQFMIEVLDAKADEVTFRILSDSETWD